MQEGAPMRRPLMLPGIFMESGNGLQIFFMERIRPESLYFKFYRESEHCNQRNPEAGDHVITTVLEHNSVLRPLYEMEEKVWK